MINLPFHLPVIRHEFAKQLINYKLLELLNTESVILLISLKFIHTFSFDLKYKYKCYVVTDFIIIAVLAFFPHFVYACMHAYI